MKLITFENPKIIPNLKRLEKILEIKISAKNKEITIDGNAEDEYLAEKIIEALDFGFPFKTALLIKEENFNFESLNIKDYTKKKDLKRVRARIIGKNGKTLKVLSGLTQCFFEIKNNSVGIIGSLELLKNAQDAVILIIQGSKQANVYSFLEKRHIKPILDLGLKEKKKR